MHRAGTTTLVEEKGKTKLIESLKYRRVSECGICHLIGNLTFDLFISLEYVSGSQRVAHSSLSVFVSKF